MRSVAYRLTLGVLILTFLIINSQASPRHYKYFVRGRAVDAQGKPVAGAVIFLDPLKAADQIFGYTTGADGRFYIEETTPAPRRRRRLYVTAPPPSGAVQLIFPPFNLLPRLTGRAFAGLMLLMRHNKVADVGDVRVQVNYGVVKIHLLDSEGRPQLTTPDRWAGVYVRLRTPKGKIIKESSLSQDDITSAVELPSSTISISLPEGEWYLDFSLDGGGHWFNSESLLAVKASNNPPQINLKLPRI